MKSIKEIIEDNVIAYLKEHSIHKNSRLVIAWSGGPDSTAVLSILKGLEGYNFHISAAWYNHGLREKAELALEENFVRTLAERMGIPLFTGESPRGEIEAMSAELSKSIEAVAREKRYIFLNEVVERENADYLVLGHNINDNTETMLMRFFQNAGIGGLSGIPKKRGVIIRPFSRINRQSIEQYLRDENLVCSVDKTNLKNDFLRNKVRLDIIPEIKEVFPFINENLDQLSDKFKLYNDFIDSEAQRRIKWKNQDNRWLTDARIFYFEHHILRIRSIYKIINLLNLDERIKYTAIEDATADKIPENGKTLLKTASFEILSRDGYIFVQRLENHYEKSYFISLKPGRKYIFAGQGVSAMLVETEADDLSEGESRVFLNFSDNLVLRSYREGDVINTKCGRKSVKKLFNEWKVKNEDRFRLPVIECFGNIRAVIGQHLGYENRFSIEKKLCGGEKKILLIFNSDTEITGE